MCFKVWIYGLYELDHFGYEIFNATLYNLEWESVLATVHDLMEIKVTRALLIGRFMVIKIPEEINILKQLSPRHMTWNQSHDHPFLSKVVNTCHQ